MLEALSGAVGAFPTLATLLWHHQCPIQPGFQLPGSPQRLAQKLPPGKCQYTLCFPPRDQPELLMLCHFPSHALLMRHGKGPARFNTPEKIPGQGSPFPLVLHKALCDQIRHGATHLVHTGLLAFSRAREQSPPLQLTTPGDLTPGRFVLSVPSPLCYLTTGRLQLKPRFTFPDPSAGQEEWSQATNYCPNSWARTQRPNSYLLS